MRHRFQRNGKNQTVLLAFYYLVKIAGYYFDHFTSKRGIPRTILSISESFRNVVRMFSVM